jgi:hypothetical protein
MTETSTPATQDNEVPRFRAAYQHLVDEIRAVPSSDVIAINIDIPTAVTTALGAMPEIRALRPRMATEIPQFDMARFDKLEAYTLAAGHAQALFLAASAPTESIDELSTSATASRTLLLSDASALANRGLLDGQRLKDLKGPSGLRNLAFDLFALSALLRDNWTMIEGKTALQLVELDKAETLADRLLTAVGLREQGPAIVAASAENRQKAFTLFVSAYDQARRAVSFLRWNEGDVDDIAPSLYAGRGTGRRAKTPPSPAPTPAAPGGPTVPTAPAAIEVRADAPAGLPTSEPFIRS